MYSTSASLRRRAGLSCLSVFVALLALAAASVQAQSVKWNPGHYVRITGDDPPPSYNVTTRTIGGVDISSADIKGIVIRIQWDQLEGATAGDYSQMDHSASTVGSINYYLDYLKSFSPKKHLIIELRERNYAGSPGVNNNDALPAYLLATPPPGHTYVLEGTNNHIWLPNYGDVDIRNRYVELLRALATRFNADPYFEGFQSGEQITNGYSGWGSGFVDLATRGKAVFTHTMFWAPIPTISSMTQTQLDDILMNAKAGEYIIDSPPHEINPPTTTGDGWNTYAYNHPHQFPVKTNGEVASWNSPSGTDDDDPNSYYTVAVTDLHAHHVAWTAINSKLRTTWWADVVTFLAGGGTPKLTNLRLPATLMGNIVVNGNFEKALDAEWVVGSGFSRDGTTGSQALKAVASGSYSETAQTAIPVSAGLSYTISHRIRVDSLSGAGFSFKYDWFDDAGAQIGSTVSQDQSTATASAYVQKTVTDTAPAGAFTLRVRCVIRSGTTSGTAYFDNISVLPNQVLNSGFELALGSEWNGSSSLIQSATPHTGTYSLKATGTGSYGERAQSNIPVNAGQTYTISGYIRVDSVSGPGFSIRYDWYDSSGASLGTGNLDQTTTTAYTLKSATVAAPTGAYTLKVRCLIKSGTTGIAYFDDVGVY